MAKKVQEYKQTKVSNTPEDHEIISQIAREKGVTRAQLYREALGFVFENPRKRLEPKTPKVEVKIERSWIYEINAIGVNLNQAVEAMHTQKALIELRALQQIIDQINNLDEKVTTHILECKK